MIVRPTISLRYRCKKVFIVVIPGMLPVLGELVL
jgi:hypothetical protein